MSLRIQTRWLLVAFSIISVESSIAAMDEKPSDGTRSEDERLPTLPFVRMGSERLQQQYGTAVAFSPDNKTLAIHNELWDLDTGKNHGRFRCRIGLPLGAG